MSRLAKASMPECRFPGRRRVYPLPVLTLSLLLAACAPAPTEPPREEPEPEPPPRAAPVSDAEPGVVIPDPPTVSAWPRAPQGITVLSQEAARKGGSRQYDVLQMQPELTLYASEMGYYVDNMEARFIQKVRDPNILFSRSGDVIHVSIAGEAAFDSDRSALRPGMKEALSPLVSILVEYNKTQVLIGGHTDDSGPAAYNQKLSEQRAFTLASTLIEAGVEPGRIAATGFGESLPLHPNVSEASRSQNRRLELRLVPLVRSPQTPAN